MMWKSLSQIDMFGTPFYFTTPSGSTHYRTLVGGLSTLAIYTVGLMYFITLLIDWKEGCILPKFSTQFVPVLYQEVELQGQFLRLSLRNQDPSAVDPFSQQNNIITPLVVEFDSKSEQTHDLTLYSGPRPIFTTIQNEERVILLENMEMVYASGKGDWPKKARMFMLVFIPCDEKYFKNGQTCAPREVIDDYVEKFGQKMVVSLVIKQYNPQFNKFYQITKTTQLIFNTKLRLYTQISLQVCNQVHDVGILMPQEVTNDFISDYSMQSQVVTEQYMLDSFGVNAIAVLNFRINDLRLEQRILEVKITEILAQVGSVISVLLTIKVLLNHLNQSLLKQELIDQIMVVIYPRMKEVKIRRNVFGRIMEIKRNESKLDISEFQKKYSAAVIKVIDKFKVHNLICQFIQLSQKHDHADFQEDDEVLHTRIHPSKLVSPKQDDLAQIFNETYEYAT